MPKQTTDYSKTVIYKIVCNDLNVRDCYVGSTTDFTRRKSQHKSHTKLQHSTHYNLKLYKTIRDHGGWDNWSMIEIESYPCESKQEKLLRERHWYEQLNATINTQYPDRNNTEYDKTYKANHQEQIKIYRKLKIKCECGVEHNKSHTARHKATKGHKAFEQTLQ
jgi:hypothetical protein